MERLQNILAKAGVASRRASAAMIEAGRVTADGIVILAPGERFDPSKCQIAVDGKPIPAMERKRTIMMYKPAGVLSAASDPFGGKTVVDIIRGKIPERLVPVGRLDKDSEGLILLSNDGGINWQSNDAYAWPTDAAAQNVIAAAADDSNYLWVVLGGSGQIWRGRLNRLGWEAK